MSERRRRSDSPPVGTRPSSPHHAASTGAGVSIRVIKVGGRAQADPRLATAIATAAERPGARIVVVHGGGDEVSAMQRRLGLEPSFIGGRRVTSAEDLDVVRMVLSGTVNKRLAAQLFDVGIPAVGISGEDGGLLTAEMDTDGGMGRVGRGVFADASLVAHLLNGGWVPVISPLARERTAQPRAHRSDDTTGSTADGRDGATVMGGTLNVNGDDAAAAIAAGLGADELLFVADVPGVLEDGDLLRSLDLDAARALCDRGVARDGMRAKLEAAASALHNGVRAVRIAALEGIANRADGTAITQHKPVIRERT